jgi:hypothetical protein
MILQLFAVEMELVFELILVLVSLVFLEVNAWNILAMELFQQTQVLVLHMELV